MDIYRQVNEYFEEVNYTQWRIVGCLYWIREPKFTSASAEEFATIMKDIIQRIKSSSLLMSARRKLEQLEANFEDTWARPEVRQYFNKLDQMHTKVSNRRKGTYHS